MSALTVLALALSTASLKRESSQPPHRGAFLHSTVIQNLKEKLHVYAI